MQNRVIETKLIKWADIQDLQPGNAKVNINRDALKASLLKYGYAQPFYGWKNKGKVYMIDGHERKSVLSELKNVPELLPCTFIDAKNKTEAVKILIEVYNQKHNPFDKDILIEFLEVENIEISEISIEDVNIQEQINNPKTLQAKEDDYEIPDEIETDIVQGDIFEIGEHRLMCGDSTDSDSVAKLMNGEKADMVFTDPPYNVDYGNSNNPRHKSRTILNDKKTDTDWDDFVKSYMSNLLAFTNGNIYISMSDKELGHMQLSFEECGGRWASFIIWVKDRLVLSGKDYHSRHETILYGWNEKVENRLRVEDRTQDDVWEIKRPSTSDLHPTMKPIELIERMLTNSTRKGMNVLDLFLGSGSTMVASHQLNRKCYGMELDPKYCEVSIQRMLKLDNTLKVKINSKDITDKYLKKIKND